MENNKRILGNLMGLVGLAIKRGAYEPAEISRVGQIYEESMEELKKKAEVDDPKDETNAAEDPAD